jgi:hypothetical protein
MDIHFKNCSVLPPVVSDFNRIRNVQAAQLLHTQITKYVTPAASSILSD